MITTTKNTIFLQTNLRSAGKSESAEAIREMIKLSAKSNRLPARCTQKPLIFMKRGDRHIMCEAHVYLLKDNVEEKILESVDLVEMDGNDIKMVNIFGEQKTVRGKLTRYNNREGKIIIEPVIIPHGALMSGFKRDL